MGARCVPTVDVRDMVCAQALALIARAMRQRQVGEALDIVYNTGDVKRDAVAWAVEQGHRVIEKAGSTLRIERRREWRMS